MKTKTIIGTIMSLLLIIGLAGCEKEEGRKITDYKEYTITVASEKVTGLGFSCGNNYVSDVYAILKEHSAEWEQLAYIEGFEYETGYEYTLRISETSYLDHNMGEPAWTEYNLIETISKEKKTSEGVPDNFIPDWFYSDYCATVNPEFQYYIDADENASIEEDINTNPMVTFNSLNCYMDNSWTRWFLVNEKKEIDMLGFINKMNKDSADIPESYKNLKPEETITGTMEWTFIIGKNPENEENAIKYDVFICYPSKSKSAGPKPIPYFFKDFTQYYQEEFPEAGVRTVVVRYSIK